MKKNSNTSPAIPQGFLTLTEDELFSVNGGKSRSSSSSSASSGSSARGTASAGGTDSRGGTATSCSAVSTQGSAKRSTSGSLQSIRSAVSSWWSSHKNDGTNKPGNSFWIQTSSGSSSASSGPAAAAPGNGTGNPAGKASGNTSGSSATQGSGTTLSGGTRDSGAAAGNTVPSAAPQKSASSPTTPAAQDVSQKKNTSGTVRSTISHAAHSIASAASRIAEHNRAYSGKISTQKLTSTSLVKAKASLVFGLGAEVGINTTEDNKIDSLYVTGSVGTGIEVATGASFTGPVSFAKSIVSGIIPHALEKVPVLQKAQDLATDCLTGSTSSVQYGLSQSTTADIAVGLGGIYDLENLNASGLPNSIDAGYVGGGVWKSYTYTFKF